MAGETLEIETIGKPLAAVIKPWLEPYVCGEAIPAFRAVMLSAPPNRIKLARTSDIAAFAPIGISRTAGTLNQTIQVATAGPIEFGGWDWTPGHTIGLSNDGTLVQREFDSGGAIDIAIAITPTIIVVRLGLPAITLQQFVTYQSALGQQFADVQALIDALAARVDQVEADAQVPAEDGGPTTYIATETISALRVLRVADNGRVCLARLPNAAALAPIGISTSAADADQALQVQRGGALQDASWAWQPGRLISLGDDGTLTQSPREDVGYFVDVGVAVASDTMVIRIGPPVRL